MANEFDWVDGRALPTQIEAEMERLVVYADAQERKVSQLQAALDARVVVERAIGILAERFGLLFPEAFELRSEEHTSELQSPYHISYAVFCLDRKSVV